MVFPLAEKKLAERAALKTSNGQTSGESGRVGEVRGGHGRWALEGSPAEEERPGLRAEVLGQG